MSRLSGVCSGAILGLDCVATRSAFGSPLLQATGGSCGFTETRDATGCRRVSADLVRHTSHVPANTSAMTAAKASWTRGRLIRVFDREAEWTEWTEWTELAEWTH